jgi:hypothetical protein
MSDDTFAISARLAFVRMDEAKRNALRELRPLILKTLPDVFDDYHQMLGRSSEIARKRSDDTNVDGVQRCAGAQANRAA